MADAAQPASRNASSIDVVLFDYGQVLSTPPDPRAWSRMQTITGLSNAKLYEAYWRFRHDYDRDTLNGIAYWHEVARHAGVSVAAEQVEALMGADADLWTQPNTPMITWAGQLQRAGIRTAILSNIGDAMAERLSARLTWLKAFELCIWSYGLRLAKPEAEIFLETAEMLNTTPSRILFIDDKEENVAGARAIGMQAIHYGVHVEFLREMRERGFTSLLDVSA